MNEQINDANDRKQLLLNNRLIILQVVTFLGILASSAPVYVTNENFPFGFGSADADSC